MVPSTVRPSDAGEDGIAGNPEIFPLIGGVERVEKSRKQGQGIEGGTKREGNEESREVPSEKRKEIQRTGR